MTKKPDDLSETKRLMGALVRMKPKPHEEMKIGKKRKAKVRKSAGADSRPRSRKEVDKDG